MASIGDGFVTAKNLYSSDHSTQINGSFLPGISSLIPDPIQTIDIQTHRSPNVVPTSDSVDDDFSESEADSPKLSIEEEMPKQSSLVFSNTHINIPAVKPLPQAQETHNGGSQDDLPPFSPPRAVDSRPAEYSQDRSNHDSGYTEPVKPVTEESTQLRFNGEFNKVFEDLQKLYHKRPTKDSLKALRLRVEAIRDDAVINLHNGRVVTQKELLSDMIDIKLLLISGKPPYCVLCGRKKVESMSIVCVYCGWVSTGCVHCRSISDSVKRCIKCEQPQVHSFSITSSHIDCRCPYIVNFKRCTKSSCKQLIKYTTSVPIPCVNCECMSTESCLHCARCRQQLKDDATSCANCHCTTPTISIKCCTKCKWLKESTSSHSKSCVHCECPHTESFKCCTKCTHTKASTVDSHAIQECTLRALQEESDWRRKQPVIYSYKHRIVKKADDVTWRILCSHCEHANHLNTAESTIEKIRRWLDNNPDNDVEIDVDDARLLLIAAAFDMYRGFVVNVDLFKKLCSPGLAHPLLQTFYSLKRYCQNPTDHPPPDIYLFLLPSYDVSQDFDQKDQVHLLHDVYMRMIKFTRVVTAIPYSPEHSFLNTSFARLTFLLPLPCCQEELIPDMLARYPQSELYCPNLSQHQSTVLMLRNGQYAESFFPQLLYSLGYWGAKELEEKYVRDKTMRRHFKVTLQPNCGIINECDKNSRQRPRIPQRSKQCKSVKFVRKAMSKAVPEE